MPRGTRRTSYVRDGRGRFASTPGGGAPKRPPAKKASRGTNRLTRDNSGRITGVGKNGATARGGRLRTGAGNLRARQTDRLKGAPQGVLSRGGKVRGKVAAAKKPVGWMQSPEARKDRVDPMSAANRKDYARRLRAVPKAAQRAIQVERSARKQKFLVAGNTAAQLTNLSEGRMQLIANVGKRKNKLTPGQIDAITRTMSESARRLKVGMAMGGRGRMKYNPKALQLAPSTAARKIRGARVVGGGVMKGKPTGKAATISREQFVARQGSRTASMGVAIASASPGGRTRMSKKQEGRMIATAERQMSAIRARDQKAGALYDALARAGRVKPPKAENRIARLTRAAQGYPELESTKAAQRLLAKRAAKPAAPKRVTSSRQEGTIAKPRGMKPGALAAKRQKPAGKQKKPLTKERISAARGKIKAKLTAVLDEIRKVENAKNRDNTPASGGFSPRFLKLIARGQKADKQLESLGRALKRLKQIELNYDPAKYGYGRGTDQRKSLAAEIRNARKQLTTLQREEAAAKKVYEADPVVRFGLWGEIGQNRRQSRKTKERKSNAAMNRVDRYIGAGIAVRQQQNAIKQLRDKAKQQTQETNKRQKPRKP